MDKVAVVMSVYNGECYIKEQISSILNQKGIQIILFIRDDGSRDSTAKIVGEYSDNYENIIFLNQNNIQNIGIKKSFFTLLREVCEKYNDINYFAFSDQDDYWKEDKIMAAMNQKVIGKKWLYYSNKTVVDENLNLLKEENIKCYGDLSEAFWGSLASGCTMVFNRELAECVLNGRKELNLLHDSQFFRVAKLVDACVVFDRNSYILYRQHGNNVCGIRTVKPTHYRWNSLFKPPQRFISSLAIDLYQAYYPDLSHEAKYYLELMMNYADTPSARWKLMLDKQARRRGIVLYSIWVGKLLLKRM